MTFKLKPKQQKAIEAARNPLIDTIVLIGSVGTGKTVVAAHIVISICYKYRETEWYAWRKNNTVSRKTLVKSYKRTLKAMNFVEGEDYTWHDQAMEIRFTHNDSVISFSEADITKDRDQNKIKGIDATGNHINEANELDVDTEEMIESRKGRNNANGQPSLNIIDMNPSNGWAKKKYYDPWKKGTLPDNVIVIEFGIKDSWQSQTDIDRLLKRSKWWVQRYLFNNWDYGDESGSLFDSRWFAENMTDKIDGSALRSSGLDVAIKRGGDRAVYSLWQGLTLTRIIVVKDVDEETNTDALTEDLIELNGKYSVGYEHSAVDAVGNGAGVIGSGLKRGHKFYEYVSGGSPIAYDTKTNEGLSFADKPTEDDWFDDKYDMLRSQVIHAFALGLESGFVKFYKDCEYLDKLQEEAMEHGFDEKDKKFQVESKKDIKDRIGISPDIFDAVIMGFLLQIRKKWQPTSASDLIML